ncbi:hypothetical protein [Nocardiopsis valliformis]|uniref:hypothetical protein n=1 Tax=Nocardiopsis valliformis TaxID=239974 RepID=UPI00034B7B1A|nr:hypothetical protein [Nocardiopsis valliformis]
MYDDIDSTYYDPLDAVEDALAIAAHSPRFWDAEGGEQASADPFEHPSWDVADALAEDGWEDPSEAALLLEQTVIDDSRLTPLAETPTGRREVHRIDELFLDAPVGEEALHEQVLALVPVATDGAWPTDEHELGVRAA